MTKLLEKYIFVMIGMGIFIVVFERCFCSQVVLLLNEYFAHEQTPPWKNFYCSQCNSGLSRGEDQYNCCGLDQTTLYPFRSFECE